MGKVNFNSDWLNRTDNKGIIIKKWCEYRDGDSLFCNVCMRKVTFHLKGYQAVKQHYKSALHCKNITVKFNNNQMQLVENQDNDENNANGKVIKLCNMQEATLKAELIWAMRVVSNNLSAALCEHISDDFKVMFPGKISENFSLGRKKFAYITTDALGPYFKQKMVESVKGQYFSLLFDETTNNESKKELQVSVRCWSDSKGEIVVYYLETFFLGHAKAEQIVSCLNIALDNAGIDIGKMLMLGCDGPNVNKKVFRLLNDQIKAKRNKSLFDFGTCTIHIVHNAFRKGLMELGNNSEQFIILVHSYFDGWPARQEDFKNIQEELGIAPRKFLKHVSSRWLTIEPAVRRIIEQWTALEKYFLFYIPEKNPHLRSANGYATIVNSLRSAKMLPELYFILSVAKIFISFTSKFQQEAPLIHIIYGELKVLVTTLMSRFMNNSTILNYNQGTLLFEALTLATNFLSYKTMENGNEVKEALKKVSDSDQIVFLTAARNFYIASCKHLLLKSSLNPESPSHILKYFNCLHPEEVSNDRSSRDVIKLSQILPITVASDTLHDEWKLMHMEEVPNAIKKERIDKYWNFIFLLKNSCDMIKYPTICNVVKSCLAISHGSADVERGFSRSSRIITEDRASMSLRHLNGRLNVADGLKMYGNKPSLVPLDAKLLSMARMAHSNYQNYLEEERKSKMKLEKEKEQERLDSLQREKHDKEVKENNVVLKQLESTLKEKSKDHGAKQKVTDKLLEEASSRLSDAVKEGNMEKAMLAQSLLEGAVKRRKEETEQLKEMSDLQTKVSKRKSNLITSFFEKKQKR